MNHRLKYFKLPVIGLCLAIVKTAGACPKSSDVCEQSKKPNLLFILVDDWGHYDVGYQGSSFYETPNIDRLAKQWIRFQTNYTASPMCSPTRLSLLTGQSPERHGVTQWLAGTSHAFVRPGEKAKVYCPKPQQSGIQSKDYTLGEAFADAGYDTAFYGKWHMGKLAVTGGPKAHGYKEQKAVIEENNCSMFFPFKRYKQGKQGKKETGYFPHAKKGDCFTDLLTDAAIEYVGREREEPFYLHLCYFAMHAPIAAKPEFRERFEEKAKALPKLNKERTLREWSHKHQKLRQDSAEYAGQLYNLDANLGRLINALKEAGKYENTIIVLTGDNGGRSAYFKPNPTSNQPLSSGKTYLFEGGIRTPLLIHWPMLKTSQLRGGAIRQAVISMDLYPTLLEMAGVKGKREHLVDGISLVPLMKGNGQSNSIQRPLYWHFPHYQGEGAYPSCAIRVGDFKLLHSFHHGESKLFNLKDDESEKVDLSEAHPELKQRLEKQLFQRLEKTHAYIPSRVKAGEVFKTTAKP